MAIKKNEILFANLSIDGGRTSLFQGTTGVCEVGHIPTKFVKIWVICVMFRLLFLRVCEPMATQMGL